MKWGYLSRNVADLVEIPRPKKQEFKTWTPEQVKIFLRTAENDRFYALYMLATTTGARKGELLALKWTNINLEQGTLQIKETIQEVPGKGLLFSQPKSEKSRRSITLPGLTVRALRQHRELNPDSELVFTTSNKTPISPRNLVKYFKRLVDEAGLPEIRFHDLRHTCATILLSENVHQKVVQELLGHSQINLTLDTYSHVLPVMQERAAQKMDEVLSN